VDRRKDFTLQRTLQHCFITGRAMGGLYDYITCYRGGRERSYYPYMDKCGGWFPDLSINPGWEQLL